MLQFAAGWLGWTPEQALECDVIYLLYAYEGRMDMMQRLFGPGPPPPPKRAKAAEIKQFAQRHNNLVRTGKIKLPKKKAKR